MNPACPGEGCIFCVRDNAKMNNVRFIQPVTNAKCVFCLDSADGHTNLVMLSCGHCFFVPCMRTWMSDSSPYCPDCIRPSVYECGHKINQRPAAGNWSLPAISVDELDKTCFACGEEALPQNQAKADLWAQIHELQSQEIPRLERIIHDPNLARNLSLDRILRGGSDPALVTREQTHLAAMNEYVRILRLRTSLRRNHIEAWDKDPDSLRAYLASDRLARW